MDEKQGTRDDFTHIHALVVGLAREGTALSRFLVERGAGVTVTDAKPAEALGENMAALAGLPVTYVLGGHPFSLLDEVDILFVSPGVPLDIPFLTEARRRGLPLSSETRLFTRLCPAPVVGITGSSGKTTTAALADEVLRAAGWRTWLGGNIGRPLIGHLDDIRPADMVVMELSSFQLEFFAPWAEGVPAPRAARLSSVLFDPAGWSPRVATVLNITPNHLDRHPSMEAYVAAKTHIVAYQGAGDRAVLNLDDPVTRLMGEGTAQNARSVLWFSLASEVQQGAFLQEDRLVLRFAGQETVLCRSTDLQLLGRHNLANSLAAAAITAAATVAHQAGVEAPDLPVDAMGQVLSSFPGVEHRLELVRELGGAKWYNDSIATSPERTVAALQSFDGPIVLLAGGRDKHLSWDEMADLTWQKVRHLILFGEAADLIDRAMHNAQKAAHETQQVTHIHHAGTLTQAVELAAQLIQPGAVVLLSPGGTSFDAYRDFVARGEHFRQLVQALE